MLFNFKKTIIYMKKFLFSLLVILFSTGSALAICPGESCQKLNSNSFGNGVNGAVTFTTNQTITTNRNYTSMTVVPGVILNVTPNVVIRVSRDLTVFGTISSDGNGSARVSVTGLKARVKGNNGSATDNVGGRGGNNGGSYGGGGNASYGSIFGNGGSYGGSGGAAVYDVAGTGQGVSSGPSGAGGGIVQIFAQNLTISAGG